MFIYSFDNVYVCTYTYILHTYIYTHTPDVIPSFQSHEALEIARGS